MSGYGHFMRIFNKISAYEKMAKVVLSIGNFDGLHRGHQYLLQKNLDLAAKTGARPAVLSFHPHPMQVFKPESFCALSSADDQELMLEQLGIEDWVIEPFSPAVQKEKAEDFLSRLFEAIPICGIVVGPDFRFGSDRRGDVDLLRSFGAKQGIEIVIPEPYVYQGQRVSSTLIRKLLQQGEVEAANDLLGRSYSIRGKVIAGFHRGHLIGFPTANISSPAAKNLRRGVYRSYVSVFGKKWLAATNVGLHPTFGEEAEIKIEAHLLDFSENLYGEDIRIEFTHFVRPEMKFAGAEFLKEQIAKDIQIVREK